MFWGLNNPQWRESNFGFSLLCTVCLKKSVLFCKKYFQLVNTSIRFLPAWWIQNWAVPVNMQACAVACWTSGSCHIIVKQSSDSYSQSEGSQLSGVHQIAYLWLFSLSNRFIYFLSSTIKNHPSTFSGFLKDIWP